MYFLRHSPADLLEHYIEHSVLAAMHTHKPCVGCYPYTQTMLLLLQWQVEDFHDRASGTNQRE